MAKDDIEINANAELINSGNACLTAELRRKALRLYQQAYNATLDDEHLRAISSNNIAAVYLLREDDELAEPLLNVALATFIRSGDNRRGACVNVNLGIAAHQRGAQSEATAHITRAADTFELLGDAKSAGICRRDLENNYYKFAITIQA
jgi:hypothetical protein